MACAGESNQEVGRAIEAVFTEFSQNNQANTADPVNVVTGGFLHSEQDVAFPSQRLIIGLSRHYNSQHHQSDPNKARGFGPGWTHSLELHVEASADRLTYVDDHGAEIIFEYESDSRQFIAPAGSSGMRLTQGNDGTCELQQIDGVVAKFDSKGRVESLQRPGPRKDSRIQFQYDQFGRLILVEGAAARGLSFIYDGYDHLIRAMRDHTGREWRYSYNGNSELVGVISPGDRARRYDYMGKKVRVAVKRKVCDVQPLRALHRVFTLSDHNNPDTSVPVVTNTYASDGRVHKQVDALGYQTKFEYNLLTRVTSVTDALGYSTVYCFDEAGNTTKVRKPSGSTVEYVFDDRRNLLAEIDPYGRRTEYVSFRDSSKFDCQSEYGNRPTGNRWAYMTFSDADIVQGYDHNGNRPLRRDASGRITLFEDYTHFGKPERVVLPDGSEILTKYEDRSGLPLRQTKQLRIGRDEPVTLIEEWEYDDWGNCLRHKTWAQTKTGHVESGCRIETFEIDPNGQNIIATKTWIDTDGGEVSFAAESHYEWDALGRLISQTSLRKTAPDAQPVLNKRSIIYDEIGRMTAEILPDGSTNCFLYDANDRLLENFHVSSGTEWNLPYVPTEKRAMRNRWEYDAGGREILHIDPSGAVTKREWDGRGLCSAIIDPFGKRTEFSYDRDGNLIQERRAFGEEIEFEHDRAGRLVNRRSNLDGDVRFASDALGRTIETVRNNGQGSVISYSYDLRDRVGEIRYPDESFEALTYDEFGNLVKRELGRLPAEVESVEYYKYDGLGRLLSVELGGPESRVEQFRFEYIDPLREVKTYDALGNVTTSNFDTEGCLTQRKDADGRVLRYQYDSMLRLIRLSSPDGLVDDTFSYASGNLLASATASSIDYRWEYDQAGRTVRHRQKVVDDLRTIEYQYDNSGRLIGKKMDNRWWMRYYYGSSWLPFAIEIPSNRVELQYDLRGRIASEVWVDGGCTSYEYFGDNTLRKLLSTDSRGEVVFAQIFEHDCRGRASRVIRSGENECSNIFHYDSLNRILVVDRLIGERNTASQRFVYDSRGNRVEEYLDGALFSSNEYDIANRIVKIRRNEESEIFEHDRSGNLIGDRKRAYIYDAFHRLRGIVDRIDGKQLATYQYAATNERVISQYEDAEERSFYDKEQEVLCDKETGCSTAFWGLELDRLLALGLDSSGVSRAYTDSSGSLIASDSSAVQQEYDPFGNVVGGNALPFRYGFGCKQFDHFTGYYYNRARFYDPKTGRFTQPDPKGLVDGVNLYIFAHNNPLQYIDKSGYTARHESHGRITDLAPALAFFPGQREGRSYAVAPGLLDRHYHVTHYDKSWNMLGRSYVVAPGWLETRPHVEHFDANWNLVGRSYVEGPGWLESRSHFQHYDKDWDRAGRTYVEGPGWLESQPHFQHYENNWDKAGRTYIEGPGWLESKPHFHHYNF